MIVVHMSQLYTQELYYTRYVNNIINIVRERGAKFIDISNFKGLEHTNEDIILFDMQSFGTPHEVFLHIKLLNQFKLNNYPFKLYYISGDIWPFHTDITYYGGINFFNNVQQTVTRAVNYKLIHVIMNLENLSYLWEPRTNLTKYLCNYEYLQFNYHYNGIEMKFNSNPINKVLLIGNVVHYLYPERCHLQSLKLPGIIQLPPNSFKDYNKQLNSYICAYVSNVSSIDFRNKSILSAKVFLLKYIEVLASGVLLLADTCIQDDFERIGLIHNINCYFTSMINIKESVDYIINPDNREKVDTIRFNGYNYYKECKNNMKSKLEQLLSDLH